MEAKKFKKNLSLKDFISTYYPESVNYLLGILPYNTWLLFTKDERYFTVAKCFLHASVAGCARHWMAVQIPPPPQKKPTPPSPPPPLSAIQVTIQLTDHSAIRLLLAIQLLDVSNNQIPSVLKLLNQCKRFN